MVRYSANAQVWEHIMGTLNAYTRKVFTKRGVIRKFKAIRQRYCRAMGVTRYGHLGYIPPVASPNRLSDDLPQ